jgi:hypothetical protein
LQRRPLNQCFYKENTMSTNSIQSFAGALFGKQVGTTTLAAVNTEIEATSLEATYNKYFTLAFGALTSTQVGELLVANLGIPAEGKDEAVAYVVGKLGAADASTHGEVISTILTDFAALTAHPVFGTSAAAWNAKIEIAVAYTGADDIGVGTYVSEAFPLTTNTDTFTGKGGDDTITGVVSSLSTAGTFNATDKIDGGDGADTLTVSLDTDFNTGLTTGSVKNVETISLKNATSVARTFNTAGITGATSYEIDANDIGFTLNNLAATTSIKLSNMDKAVAAFTTTFAAAAAETTGTADSMALHLNGVGVADNAATSADEQKIVTVTLTGAETAAVTSTGTNVVDFAGTLKTITVAGDGSTKITAAPSTLTSFDASAATGKMVADLTGAGASKLTAIKTGAGDDSVTLDAADAASNAITISGGAGADTLTLNSGARTVQYVMSDVETLALNAVTGAMTISALKTTGLTTISSVAATANGITVVGLGANDLTVAAKGATVNAGAISADQAGAATVNYTALAASIAAKTADAPLADYTFANAAGALTVNVGSYVDANGSDITANKATSLVVNVESGKDSASTPAELTDFGGTVTVDKATSVTVNAAGKIDTATIAAAEATAATISNGSTAGNLTLTGAKFKSFSLTSDSAFTTSGTAFDAVETANITMNNGAFNDGAADTLPKISTLNVSGAGVSTTLGLSKATFGDLGASDINYNMAVTASGLKGGFTVGTMNVAAGFDISANVAGVTGAVTLGAVTTAKNVTIDATGAGAAGSSPAAVGIGAITATGAITVKAATKGAVTLGNISAGETGAVNVDFSGTSAVVRMGTFAGNTVTVNAADTIGGVGASAADNNTFGVTAKTSADIAVSSLLASTVTVGSSATSTGLAVKVTGGSMADTVTVTGNAASTSLVLTGDLALGTDSVTVNGAAYAGSATQTISLAGLSNYDASTLNGSNKKDVIIGGAGVDRIMGGAGQDTMTGGAGKDTFVINANDSSYLTPDTITDFSSTDEIEFGSAATTWVTSTAVAGTTTAAALDIYSVATFSTLTTAPATLTAAATAVEAAVFATSGSAGKSALFSYGGTTYMFISDGTTGLAASDVVVALTGVVLPSATLTDNNSGTGLTGFGA